MEKMKRAIKKNQKGSVLLAVVCMGMICLTMATIALSVVNYTNGATARNVMRTQAKITAESCLAEFIGSYDVGNQDDCKALQALAVGHTKNTPRVIDVNPGNATFTQNYGDAEIQIYNVTGGFKVASVCTFGDTDPNYYIRPQTQTASVMFAYASTTPQVTSSALECSEGYSTGTGQQMNIEGDFVIEKDSSEPTPPGDKLLPVGVNSGLFKSHIYSEYSLTPSNGGGFMDVWNKTGTLNYQPNKSNNKGNFFRQAPVLWTDGYLGMTNNEVYIGTEYGKTDVNLYNKYTNPTGYGSAPLSNMDGFIYVNKQIMLTGNYADKIHIGYKDNGTYSAYPIDTYCGGFYFGAVPSKVEYSGTQYANNHYNAAKDIKDPSNNTLTAGGPGSRNLKIHGNVYCYSNGETASNNYSKSGSLWILEDSSAGLTIDGDLYVENDIFVRRGAYLKVTGKIHCKGSIFAVDYSGGAGGVMTVYPAYACDIVSGHIDDSSAAANYKIGTSGNSLAVITATNGFDKEVDKDGGYADRDKLPTPGYNAATGISSSSRRTLKDMYKMATTNCIFRASADPAETYHSEAKDIAEKYAQALATPISSYNTLPRSNATDVQKFADMKYKDSTGAAKKLLSIHGSESGGNVVKNIYEIKSSCRFTSKDQYSFGVNSNEIVKYVIKLTDEDIVIALPIIGSDNIYPITYVDSTERVGEVFVYFMYYDPTKLSESESAQTITVSDCMYLSKLDPDGNAYAKQSLSIDLGTNVYKKASDSFVKRTVIFNTSESSYRSGLHVKMNPSNMTKHFSIDLDLFTPYADAKIYNEAEICNYFDAGYDTNDSTDNVYGNVMGDGAYYQNYIFYLVPDEVSWELNSHTRLQGIIYAPASEVTFHSNNCRVYGKVKCKKFITDQEANQPMVVELPEAKGSILEFLGAGSSSVSEIQMRYYEY